MHQNVYTSDVRKSSTCYHFFEPQDIFSLGSGPLLCRTVTWSGTCLGHQSQVPNLGFCHLISSPCCSLSTYCLCYSCYRFSVLKRFRHCLPHTHFTAQPPTCSIQHYRSLPSLLQFAVWMRSWHSQRHTIHSSLSSTTVTVTVCHLEALLAPCNTCSSKRHQPAWFLCFPVTFLNTAMLLTALLSLSASCAGRPKLWAHFSFGL